MGYPDIGWARGGGHGAEDAGIPYIPFSAGYVGLPGTEGALTPGEDYLTVVGEDLCARRELRAGPQHGVGTGEVAILGGTPNNALPRLAAVHDPGAGGWVDLVNPPPNENTTTGDTFWSDSAIPSVFQGLLTTNPEIKGYAYEYADGMNTGLQEYEALDIPVENLTLALRTDEQTCSATGSTGLSRRTRSSTRPVATSSLAGDGGDDEHRRGTDPGPDRRPARDAGGDRGGLQPDRVNPYVSGTSLVPDSVLGLMFAS